MLWGVLTKQPRAVSADQNNKPLSFRIKAFRRAIGVASLANIIGLHLLWRVIKGRRE